MIFFLKIVILFKIQLPTDGQAGQHTGPSRVAAVGPYIQSTTMPRGQGRQDALVKPAYPDGTATLPAHDPRSHSGTGEYVQSYIQAFTELPLLQSPLLLHVYLS